MAIKEIHVGDIGTIFEVTLKDELQGIVNVSSQTFMQICFRRPDKSVFTRNAVFTTDGTDGKIQYVTVAGDLNIQGVAPNPNWALQAVITLPTGTWRSDICIFDVHPNICP